MKSIVGLLEDDPLNVETLGVVDHFLDEIRKCGNPAKIKSLFPEDAGMSRSNMSIVFSKLYEQTVVSERSGNSD